MISLRRASLTPIIRHCASIVFIRSSEGSVAGGDVLGSVNLGFLGEFSWTFTFFGIPVIMPASGYPSSSRLLLHECWQLSAGDPRHTSAEEPVEGVPRERFGRVLLVHHNPSWDDAESEGVGRIAARHDIELAQDGMVIAL